MKIWHGGKEYDIPTREDGSIDEAALREASSIARNRVLIHQHVDGANEVVNPGQAVFAQPDDRFADTPIRERGK